MDNNQPIEFDNRAMLGEAFAIFKKLFSSMMLMYLVFFLISALVAMGLGTDQAEPDPMAMFINIFVAFVLTGLLSGVYTASVWSYINNHDNPIKEGISRCIDVLPRLLGSMFLVGVAILAGLVLFIIPGIVVALALSLVVPVVIIENPGMTESLKRSYEITDGHKSKILMLLIMVIVILVVPVIIASFIFGAGQLEFITQITSSVATIFNSVLYVVIYKHLSNA